MGQYTIKDVQNRAELLKDDIDNIYRALNDKLGSSPETLDKVPEYILSIPDLPTEEPLTITPTIDGQEISTFEDLKYNPITVEPVTSSIDSNIQPENIKEGVSILGVAGALKGEKPEESFNVQPTTAEQTITPTAGSVFSGGTVRAVTSSIDSNIQPENIKEGVSILGVAGTLSGGGGSDVFIVPPEQGFAYSKFTEIPSNYDFREFSNVTDASYLFYYCSNLTTIPQIDFSSVTNASRIFYTCNNLTTIPQIDFSSVTNASSMFYKCGKLTTIPQLNLSSVTNANSMFNYCTSLTTVPSLDLSNATDTSQMFYGCNSLKTILQLNLSSVTNASSMFYDCTSLNTVEGINFSSVKDTSYLFYNCRSLPTVSKLDTYSATSMGYMFSGCTALTTVEGIDFSGLTKNLTNLFGWGENMTNLTRFIVNGKINVSISDNNCIKKLTAIDYDSVKSILAAADRTDNTNAKTLAFNRTMTDQNGELAALVASCTSKGWTISGLTLQ